MIGLPNIHTVGVDRAQTAIGASKIIKLGPSILGIVISLAVLGFVVWPKFNEVLKLRAENKQLEERSGALKAKSQFLAELSVANLEQQLIAAERLVPSDKAVFSMIAQIERSASTSGVILNKVDLVSTGSVGDKTGGSGQVGSGVVSAGGGQGDILAIGVDTPRIQIRVAITSDYLSALRFINDLISSTRVVMLSDLTMSTGAATGGAPSSLKSTMVVNAFWKPLPSELPALEAPVANISPSQAKILEDITILERSGESTAAATVPQVTIGRQDLFAPF